MNSIDCGYWEVTVEAHGRIKLPAALLKLLEESERKSFVVSRGFGKHLSLWTQAAFAKQLEFLNSLDMNIIRNRKYRNAFIKGTAYLDADAQGRLIIPKSLIAAAEIDKEMAIVLDNGAMELWDKQRYEAEFNMSDEEFMELNQQIHIERSQSGREATDVS